VKTVFLDCPQFTADLYSPELRAIVPDLVLNVEDAHVKDIPAVLGDGVGAILDHSFISEAALAACPQLKFIVFMGAGASSYVDMEAAERLGIRVRTILGYGDRSIAEHAIGLMFAGGRQIATMDRAIRAGEWLALEGMEFEGKTLGVVGTSGIGKEMVRLGAALGMRVIAWNRSGVAPDLPCEETELDALLARSDVVSLHLALNDETRGMIDARRIGLMQPHAILVNTARGALLDEDALVDALHGGRLGHAALDVLCEEPLPAEHPLRKLTNVTLTPHAAFMTKEAATRLLRLALELTRDELAALQSSGG